MSSKKRIEAYLNKRESKKGDSIYTIRYVDIDGSSPRESLGQITQRKASRILSEFNAKLNTSEVIEARSRGISYQNYLNNQLDKERKALESRKTIKEFFEAQLEVARVQKARKTFQSYSKSYRQFIAFMNKKGIEHLIDITYESMEQFMLYLKGELQYKPATVDSKIQGIKVALNAAVKHGFIQASPATRLASIKIPQNEILILTPEEWTRLLNVVESDGRSDYVTMLMTCMDTACRPMEIFTIIRKKDFHFEIDPETGEEYGTIDIVNSEINTKNKKNRSTPLRPETVKRLKKYLSAFRDQEHPFGEMDKDHGKQFRIWMEKANIFGRTFYAIRRTALTKYAETMSVQELNSISGHSSIEVTRRFYLKVEAKEVARKVARQLIYKPKDDSDDKKGVKEGKLKYGA